MKFKREIKDKYFRNFVAFALFLAAGVIFFPVKISAQVPSMVCLGTCPTPTTATTNVAAEVAATTPTTGVSITPTANPSITQAQTPSSTPVPCKQPDIYSLHSAGNTEDIEHNRRRWRGKGGKGTGGSQGIIQLLLNLLQQILQLIQQLLGIGGGGGSTSITPIKTTPMVTANPCPSNTPGTQPTSSTTATTAPSSSVTTTVAPSSSVTATVGPTQSGIVPSVNPPSSKTSGNWAGYAYSDSGRQSGALVTASWVVGKVNCTTKGIVSPWVGFGGEGTSEIAQLGVDYDCSNGSPAYATWTEAYPASSVYYNDKPVKEGDKIVTTVTFTGGNNFSTKIDNATQGWSLTVPMSLAQAIGGEVIVEKVGSTTIPSFDPIVFIDSNFTNAGGALQPIAAAPSLKKIEMTNVGISGISGTTFTANYR